VSETFTVSAVSKDVRKYNSQFGELAAFKVRFQERGNDVVEWSRKPDNAPTVGQVVTGTVTDNPPYGLKFKQDKPADMQGRSSWGGSSSKGDFRSKEQIILQECDRTAALVVAAAVFAGKPVDDVMRDFYKLTAEFQTRTNAAAKEYAAPADNAVRKDIERTGESDVPNDTDGFDTPKMGVDPEDIPF